MAIKNLPHNKSLGPDGYSSEYYQHILSPHLHRSLEAAKNTASFPQEMLMAIIITLPKPGKEPNLPQNFRPISLLNVDVKLYAKLIAHRLMTLLPKLINSDQVGFVMSCQTTDATRSSSLDGEERRAFSASNVRSREGFRQSSLGVFQQSFGKIRIVWPNTKCDNGIILISLSICL